MPERRYRRGIAALLSVVLLSGFTLFDSWFAPSADLWPKWQAYDRNSTATVDHGAWDAFLKTYVSTDAVGLNRVDYRRAAKEAKPALHAYLASLREVRVATLNRREQMAYWINLYNALTVRLILDFYPVRSIRDISFPDGAFSTGPWDKKLIRIDGEMLSLNDIEHRILRPIWQDPRIHYAVNCAAYTCPNLGTEAYRGRDIDQMLDAAAKAYVNNPRGLALKDGKLVLSRLYSWYAGDFGGERGVLQHVAEYSTSDTELKLMMADGVGDYVYDWALNDLE